MMSNVLRRPDIQGNDGVGYFFWILSIISGIVSAGVYLNPAMTALLGHGAYDGRISLHASGYAYLYSTRDNPRCAAAQVLSNISYEHLAADVRKLRIESLFPTISEF